MDPPKRPPGGGPGGPTPRPPTAPRPALGLPPARSVTGSVPEGADSQFAAFLRGLGQEESAAWRRASFGLSSAKGERDTRLTDLLLALADARENKAGDYESRGFVRSGELNKDYALMSRDYGRDVGNLESGYAREQSTIQLTLREALDELARRRAEEELALAQRNEARRLGQPQTTLL